MATRPSEKPAWVPSNDPAKIVAPSASKKNTGWLQEEKPPFQYFNWFWNLIDAWLDYFGGYVKYNVVIDSVAAEADFSSLAAYIAAAPAAGDRVLVKVDEVLTTTLIIPAGVEVTFLKEKKLSTITVFTPVIQLGDRSAIRGDAKLETSHTGTIVDAVSFNGDGSSIDNLVIENTTTGIVTDAVQIEAGKTNNLSHIQVNNTGAGSITNSLNDASTNNTNDIIVRDDLEIQTAGSLQRLVQQGYTQDGDVATGTTVFPIDDTIPQITEGDEYMTVVFTPKKATNLLKIDVIWFGAHSTTTTQLGVGLFQDAIANAISAGRSDRGFSANARATVVFTHQMVAGTTSAITFRVRAGSPNAGTTTFNGQSGVRDFGGVIASSITVTEITP